MKTTLFALFFLCSTAAVAQSVAGASVISFEPQPLQMPSHELRATQRPMAEEQNILINSVNPWAQGERPLWEVGAKPPVEAPLGDVARLLRNQHATAKKAVMVVEQ